VAAPWPPSPTNPARANTRMAPKTLALALVLVALSFLACVKASFQPPRCERADLSGCSIEGVDVYGNRNVSGSDITSKIATAETKHVLAGALEHVPILSLWDRLTVEYERLDPFVLQRDLDRIERLYRARGYYEAHVRAGRIFRKRGDAASVEIIVDEGKPVKVARVDINWKDYKPGGPDKVLGPVKSIAASLKRGAVFEEVPFEATKQQILRALTDRGFAYAKVEGQGDVDIVRHEARVVYTIALGPHCTFGHISITGRGDLSAVPLLAALQIDKGDEFSTSALDSAQGALLSFGVFGSIDVQPKLAAPGTPQETVIPVIFQVQPVPMRAVKLGGGAEIGNRIEAHGLAGWEHWNLFGGLRHFTIDASPAVTLFPLTFNSIFNGGKTTGTAAPDAPRDPNDPFITPLLEFKLRSSLTQPGFLLPFDARTRAVITASFSRYRLPTIEPTARPVVGYLEGSGGVGLERPFWDAHVNLELYLNLQYDNPFRYDYWNPALSAHKNLRKNGLVAAYTNLVIPYVQSTATLDMRESEGKKIDAVDPHQGLFVTTDTQFAFNFWKGELLGANTANVADVRVRPEVRGYVPITKKVTLALRLVMGVLAPFGYGNALRSAGDSFVDADGDVNNAACHDLQIMQFRGFYSGGANSNRGYPYNGVGAHKKSCLPNGGPGGTGMVSPNGIDSVATGGFYLWETSVEVRAPIVGELGTAIFVDASDTNLSGLRLCAPHLSAGLGLRYNTPVGPFRADIGYRVTHAQVVKGVSACANDVDYDDELDRDAHNGGVNPLGDLAGLPIAVSVAIGQAF
jgi:outer membrane protein assembly factor BamA